MSRTIDEKVVSMQFDNSHFEKNVQTSMGTLEKLKNSLKLDGAAKGLDNISASARKCDVSPLGNGIESVKMKFSALEVMAVTALANITNSALNAGKTLVKTFTLDPIITGFSEYELKMGSIQTIMAGTGESLDTVNDALNELNEYSDKTIYSFADMTQNIGKFTNAGVSLDQSVGAIQGIANAAALAGANSNEASRAMYNFSQALSIGYVGLMDWKSIELANMATKDFRLELINSAEAMGTLVKVEEGLWKTTQGTEVTVTNFRNTLNDQWLTSDALVDTLGRYADETTEVGKRATQAATEVKTFSMMMDTLKEAAQSGWAQTWEVVIGDFEQGKKLWTEWSKRFGELIGSSADNRNAILLGGLGSKWDQLISKINDAGISTDQFSEKLAEAAVAQDGSLQDMIDSGKSIVELVKDGSISTDTIVSTIKSFSDALPDASSSTEDLTGKLEKFQKVVNEVWMGDFANGEERIKALSEAGYDYAEVQALVNKTVDGQKLTLEDLTNVVDGLSDSQLENIGYTEEEVKALRSLAEEAEKTGTPLNELIDSLASDQLSGREHIIQALANAFEGLQTALGAIKEAWNNIFYPDQSDEVIIQTKANRIYELAEAIHKLSEYLNINDETAEKLRKTFEGLFAILDIIWTIAGGAARIAFRVLSSVLKAFDLDILDVTASVGEAIVAFRDWLFENNFLAKGIEKVVEWCKKGYKIISQWVKSLLEIQEVRDVFTSFGDGIGKAFSGISDYFSEGISRISEFIEYVKSLDKISLDNISEIIGKFKTDVIDYFLDIDLSLDGIKKAFEKFGSDLGDVLGKIDEKFGYVAGTMEKFVEYIRSKLPSAISIGLGAILIKAISDISDVLGLLAKPLGGMAEILGAVAIGLKKLGRSVTRYFNAKAFQAAAGGIRDLAMSILIIAGAIAILTLVPEDRLWGAVGAIAAITAVLGVFALAMAALKKVGKIEMAKVGLIMLEFGAAMLLLAGVLKIVGGMEVSQIHKGIAVVTALGLLITGLIWATKLAAKDLKNIGSTIMQIGIAIGILGLTVKLAGSMEIDDMHKGVAVVGVLGVLVAGLIWVTKLAGNHADKIGSTMTKIGLALLLMVATIKVAALLSPKDIVQGLFVVAALEIMIVRLVAISKFSGQYSDKAGKMVAGIGVGLFAMISAMRIAASLSKRDVTQGLFVIGALELMMAGLIAISSLSGKNAAKAGAMILMISGSLLIMVGVIHLLKDIEKADLEKAVDAIQAIGLMFMGLIAVTKLAKESKGNIIALTVAVAAMALAIKLLSDIPKEDLAAATFALGGIMAVFGLLIVATKFINVEGKGFLKALAVIGVMTLVVGALAFIISQLAACEGVDSAVQASAALSILIVSLSAACVILGKTGESAWAALPAAGVMLGVVAVLALILGVLAKQDVGPTLEIAASLSILLLSLSGACWILAAVGPVGKMALIGAGVLDGVILILGGLMVGLGALMHYVPEVEIFLDKGITVLEKIGTGLGSFFGSIVGGFFESAASVLPGIGKSLSGFMDSISGVDTSALDAAKTLSETMLLIGGASFLNTISRFLNFGKDPIAEFAENIVTLAGAIQGYSAKVSEAPIDLAAIETSTKAATLLADLADAIPDSSLLAKVVELKDLGTFGEQLTAFAKGLTTYSTSVSAEGAINTEAIETSTKAATLLADLADAIPDSSLVAKVVERKDFGKFGEQLTAFAKGLTTYSAAVSAEGAINTEAIATSIGAAAELVTLADTVPDSSLVAKITDNQNLGNFGKQLTKFAEGLSEYSVAAAGIDAGAIDVSIASTYSLINVLNSVPEESKDKVKEFKNSANNLGEALSDLSVWALVIDNASILAATGSCQSLIDIFNNLAGLDTSGVSSFADGIAELGEISIDGLANAFGSGTTEVVSAINSLINAMTSTLSLSIGRISGILNQLTTIMVQTIASKKSAFGSAGQDLIRAFQNGVSAAIGSASVSSKITEMLSSCETTINDYYGSFYDAGGYLVEGFAAGVEDSTYAAEAAAKAMAQAAIDAAEELFGIQSPSKVFRGIGDLCGQGFVLGLSSTIPKVVDNASDFGNSVISTLVRVLDIHSPSQITRIIGQNTGEGFIQGLVDTKPNLVDALVDNVSDVITNIGGALSGGANNNGEAVGNAVSQGVATGITQNNEPEKSAEEKAKAIVEAFKKELDKFDLDIATADLEYELWTKLNEKTATDADKADAELGTLAAKLQLQSEKVLLAQQEYEDTLAATGASSEETQTAYNKYLQEQIDLANLSSELTTAQEAAVEKNKLAKEKYLDYLWQNQEDLTKMGLSIEEIKARALKESGYDPDFKVDSEVKDIQTIIAESLATAQTVYEKSVTNTVGTMAGTFGTVGTSYAEAVAQGILNYSPNVITTIQAMLEDCSVEIKNQREAWVGMGTYLVEGFIQGVQDSTSNACLEAYAMAAAAAQAARDALGEKSPSKVFYDIGAYAGDGLVNALNDYSTRARDAGTEMAKASVDGLKGVISGVSDVLASDLDTQPTIRPVVDMANLGTSSIKLNSSLETTLIKPIDSLSQMVIAAQAEINASNREVITAINGLRSDLNSLYSADDSEIALYVDSKKLATSLAKPMNRQLNILSKRGAY